MQLIINNRRNYNYKDANLGGTALGSNYCDHLYGPDLDVGTDSGTFTRMNATATLIFSNDLLLI